MVDFFNPAGRGGVDVQGIFDQAQARALQNTLGQSQQPLLEPEFQQLLSVDPKRAQQLVELTGAQDNLRLNAMLQDAKTAKLLLQNDNLQGAAGILQERLNLLQGRDSTQTAEVFRDIIQGQPDQAIDKIDNFLRAFDPSLATARPQTKTTSVAKVDPNTGQIFHTIVDPNTQQATRIDVPGAVAQTPSEKRTGEVNRDTQKTLFKQAADASKSAFEQLPKIRNSIGNINKALKFVNQGAETGPIAQLLPSVTEASVNLDNIAGQMGLDLIGATTFGALSESELQFALSTSLPQGLEGPSLKQWLIDKRNSQEKLAKELRKMAIFLGKGDKTIADYLSRDDVNFSTAPTTQTDQTGTTQVLKFDAQGNQL